MRKSKKLQYTKSIIAIALTGVLTLGQGSAYGSIGGFTVQAAESSTQITSLEYYDEGNGEFSKSASSATSASLGFVMPKFNGLPSSELSLANVQDDLTLYVKQENGTNGQWVDIDQNDYFQFNSTWGWEWQDWGGDASGWICWFKIDETTELKFQSNSHPDVSLHYVLGFTKLPTISLNSMTFKESTINSTATGKSGIAKADFIFNGDPNIQYSQVENDFNDDNILITVKRDSESEFVPLFDNFEAGWQYDHNFGVFTEGGGGWWFANLTESITVRFHSQIGKFNDIEVRINYSKPSRDNYSLTATNGTEFDANRDDHSAVIGLCLPRIGGTEVYQDDLDKFTYEIKDNGQWKNLSDVWLYRENGYSSLSDRTQWGFSVNDLYELWFKPVKADAELRIGFPMNGQKGGDIGDNYIYYTFKGDPDAVIPDVSDMGEIRVDNKTTGGDVTNVDVPEGWTLIWNDEFNGTKLDKSKWDNQTGYLLNEDDVSTYGWGNAELEYYTDSENNTSVHDGCLNLTLLKESKEFKDTHGNSVTAKYSSGKVLSQNKFSVKYGRVDFRAKLPDGAGIWPALWMMPNENTYGTWARSGELDVMEGRGRTPDVAFGTLHYGDQWPGDKEDGLTMSFKEHGLNDMTDWHVYSVVWEEDNIKIYCDGICYYKGTNQTWYSAGARDNKNAPFDIQYYLIMNLAAGGYFDGMIAPDESVTRKDMYVDYVRVYQRNAEAGEPDANNDGLYGDYNSQSSVTPIEGNNNTGDNSQGGNNNTGNDNQNQENNTDNNQDVNNNSGNNQGGNNNTGNDNQNVNNNAGNNNAGNDNQNVNNNAGNDNQNVNNNAGNNNAGNDNQNVNNNTGNDNQNVNNNTGNDNQNVNNNTGNDNQNVNNNAGNDNQNVNNNAGNNNAGNDNQNVNNNAGNNNTGNDNQNGNNNTGNNNTGNDNQNVNNNAGNDNQNVNNNTGNNNTGNDNQNINNNAGNNNAGNDNQNGNNNTGNNNTGNNQGVNNNTGNNQDVNNNTGNNQGVNNNTGNNQDVNNNTGNNQDVNNNTGNNQGAGCKQQYWKQSGCKQQYWKQSGCKQQYRK